MAPQMHVIIKNLRDQLGPYHYFLKAYALFEADALTWVDCGHPFIEEHRRKVDMLLSLSNTTNYEIRLLKKICGQPEADLDGQMKKGIAALVVEIAQSEKALDVHMSVISHARKVAK